ncbi:MAG: trehalose-phosphatase [Pseudomonadota bacterium]
MTETPPPPIAPDWALFLDFDGVLAEIVDDPEAVTVAPDTHAALPGLRDRLGGAMAMVSGRPIATIDRVLAPLTLPVAGLHGLERRDGAGTLQEPAASEAMDAYRDRLLARAEAGGFPVEDKGASIALHYRRTPERKDEAVAVVTESLQGLDDLHLIHGKMVLEVKPQTSDKGVAVETFMAEAPFSGRMPIFVGDDVTDEDGFRAAQRLGGFGVKVGPGETAARHRLDDVTAVGAWLKAGS